MEKNEIQETLIACFTQKKGCRVVTKKGETLEVVAGTLNVTGVKDGFAGDMPNGDFRKIMLIDVESVEILEEAPT